MGSITRNKQAGRAQTREPTKKRLLAAVESLLSDGNIYTELSVARLIKEADVSRSTFYVHFADKGDLLRALTNDVAQELAMATSTCWDLPAGGNRKDLACALRFLCDTYRRHADLLAAVVEAAGYDITVREHWANLMETTIADATIQIRQGQRTSLVRADVKPAATATWLIWMIERGMYQLLRHATPEQTDELLDELTTLIWCRLYEGVR